MNSGMLNLALGAVGVSMTSDAKYLRAALSHHGE